MEGRKFLDNVGEIKLGKVVYLTSDKPWGNRHFATVDPNGIGIDLVTFKDPDE